MLEIEILPTPRNTPAQFNTRFAEHLVLAPPRDPAIGDHGARAILGEVIAATLLDNYNAESGSFLEREVGLSYVLLGDPGTRISVGAPEMIVTANGAPVTSGIPVRLTTFGDTLAIEAEVVSNVELKTLTLEYTDGTGTHLIPASSYTVTPAFPDTTPGGLGGRRYHLSYRTTLSTGSYHYVIRSVDRNGLATTFDITFEFQTLLRADGTPIQPNDPVRKDANLSLLVLSPSPILDPNAEIQLTLDGAPLAFTATPFQGDTTQREYVLTWVHGPYAAGKHTLVVELNGQVVNTLSFSVSDVARLDNLMAFPNPFDDELGTRFSFTYTGGDAFDLLVRVFTVAGHLIYEHEEKGLQPGYHQIAWNGADAEGSKLANGIYFYKILAKGAGKTVVEQGRLVKLRKPRRIAEPDLGSAP